MFSWFLFSCSAGYASIWQTWVILRKLSEHGANLVRSTTACEEYLITQHPVARWCPWQFEDILTTHSEDDGLDEALIWPSPPRSPDLTRENSLWLCERDSPSAATGCWGLINTHQGTAFMKIHPLTWKRKCLKEDGYGSMCWEKRTTYICVIISLERDLCPPCRFPTPEAICLQRPLTLELNRFPDFHRQYY